MKIRPVGAELLHGAGRTDRHDEANSRFSPVCERVKEHHNSLISMKSCVFVTTDSL